MLGEQTICLDGTKMRAVARPKNIADAELLARDLVYTEHEIGYDLDRLDMIDEQVAPASMINLRTARPSPTRSRR